MSQSLSRGKYIHLVWAPAHLVALFTRTDSVAEFNEDNSH